VFLFPKHPRYTEHLREICGNVLHDFGHPEYSYGMRKIGGKWTRWNCFRTGFRYANLVRDASGFHRFPECRSHSTRVGRYRDRRVHQDGVCPKFHRLCRVAWRSYPCIYHHRNSRLIDNDPDLIPGLDPAVASNRRPERHNRRRANFLQSFCQDRIGISGWDSWSESCA
jgi:hypothetical protein